MNNITTTAYNRNHRKNPTGTGTWAFAPTTNHNALPEHINHDQTILITGTYTQARKQATTHFNGQLIAVLP